MNYLLNEWCNGTQSAFPPIHILREFVGWGASLVTVLWLFGKYYVTLFCHCIKLGQVLVQLHDELTTNRWLILRRR